MKNIEFKAVKKKYEETTVIQELNFSIKEGERLVLLGPSGCGKTTTLRMIAGLEEISEGQLLMGGTVVNEVAPGKRNIAMVFQNYALFPHLSVWENITFGLKIQKLTEQEMAKRAKEALEILNLTGYENRKPKELSGGQKQRVALCRAIVKQSPYFLLDEPLSNLDAQLRQQARTELVKLHEIYKPTMIYVTHDQVEAMTIAQRIAIMNKGELQQIDTPENIYHRPANTFVASFIGTPPMNLLSAHVRDHWIFIGDACVPLDASWDKVIAGRSRITLGIRPEKCYLAEEKPMVPAVVSYVENLGNQRTLRLTLKNQENVFVSTKDFTQTAESTKGFSFRWEDVSVFDYKTGINIGYPTKEGGKTYEICN